MRLPRRAFLRLAAGAAALPALSRTAWPQTYPSRLVRLVVGFPPGSTNDILARLIGQWLAERLGQPFVIENRPGAGSNIATEMVARSPADGHTLLMAATSSAINATLYDKLSFNFIRDFAPVASLLRQPHIMLVNPSVPTKTLSEFIALAKANPGKINMASSGSGTGPHMAGELFKMMAKVDLVHVPYRGGAQALTDLLGGQAHMMLPAPAVAMEYIRNGTLRPLGVTTAARSEALPDIPTISEFVPGYEADTWFGIVAPRSTPADIINRLNREINAGLADAKLRARLDDLGGGAFPSTPEQFGKLIADDTEKWGKVVRAANVKVQ
jgi:tripartite-type tricarboxylate transporter receptor subunit TctC